jgi:hypothetical protein
LWANTIRPSDLGRGIDGSVSRTGCTSSGSSNEGKPEAVVTEVDLEAYLYDISGIKCTWSLVQTEAIAVITLSNMKQT